MKTTDITMTSATFEDCLDGTGRRVVSDGPGLQFDDGVEPAICECAVCGSWLVEGQAIVYETYSRRDVADARRSGMYSIKAGDLMVATHKKCVGKPMRPLDSDYSDFVAVD